MKDVFVCIATFSAKSGKAEELKLLLAALIEPTRVEDGCLSYELHQEINNPEVFTMVEKFKNIEAFEFHGNQQYLINFKHIAEQFISSVSVKSYKAVQ